MANIKLIYTKENVDYYHTLFFISNNKKALIDIWKIYNIHDSKSNPFLHTKDDYGFIFRSVARELNIFQYGKYFLPVNLQMYGNTHDTKLSRSVCLDIAIAIAHKNPTILYKHLNHKNERVACFSNYFSNFENKNDYDLTIHTIQHRLGI